MNSRQYARLRGRSEAWVSAQITTGMPAKAGGRSGRDYEIDPVAALKWELARKSAQHGEDIGPPPEVLHRFGGNFLRMLTFELCKQLAVTGPQCLAIAAKGDGWAARFGLTDDQIAAVLGQVWVANAQILKVFLEKLHDQWFAKTFGSEIDDAGARIWPSHGLSPAPMPAGDFLTEIGGMPPALVALMTEGAIELLGATELAWGRKSAH